MTTRYQQELGSRLRSIRNMQGLTLHDVEERSEGTWKAVVIGSYERGDRAISVAKLAALADFYRVPVRELLPQQDAAAASDPGGDDLVIDLTALDPEARGPLGAVSRYAHRIQVQRGDYNGRMLTIRSGDLGALAAACGLGPDELVERLEEHAVVTSHR